MEHKNLKTFPTLITERLTLRQLADSDTKEIFLLRSDILINKYLDRAPCRTLDDALKFIAQLKNNSLSYWAITQKGDAKLMGTICLFDISEELQQCEIGYELLADYQGKGIMREAAKAVIDYAMQTLSIKTIDAQTHNNNQSSTKLLKDLDFVRMETYDEKNPNLISFRLHRNTKGK